MFPPFPQELARHYCMEFISGIEDGSIILEQISQESEERKGHGVMIGALVCVNDAGERIVLHAVSGISVEASITASPSTSSGTTHIIVPPIVSERAIAAALAKNDKKIHELTETLRQAQGPSKKELQEQRTLLTDESLRNVFSLYTFIRFDGKKITLNEIIKQHGGRLPPTGTGDCCAPKLLSYAFERGLTPISMDEVFYGRDTPNKKNGTSYPPCDERCGYILSVPGRTPDKQDCVVSRLKKLFPHCIEQPSVHRLDMETSGLLVLAFTEEAHRNLSHQFEEGTVHKKYVALIDGVFNHNEYEGELQLKFRLDVDNRPHQIYDEVYGKTGITEWEFIRGEKGGKSGETRCRMLYTPKTGRTHQLRLHSADVHGFGVPICGDELYGSGKNSADRLLLHAAKLEFTHPVTGERIKFFSEPEF